MQPGGQATQPTGHRRGAAGGEQGELATDAHLNEHPDRLGAVRRLLSAAEEMRHHDGVARASQVMTEGDDLGGEARALVHEDDTRSGAAPVGVEGEPPIRVA